MEEKQAMETERTAEERASAEKAAFETDAIPEEKISEGAAAGEETEREKDEAVTRCDFCGRVIDVGREDIYPDSVTGKIACKACNKQLKRKYRAEYFEKRNSKRKVWETVLIALGAVMFLAVGIAGLTDAETRVMGILFLLAGIGYGAWFIVPLARKKK